MTLAEANISQTLETITSQSDQLRRRLRTIKRFRRQSLTSRAMRLEAVLAEILLNLSNASSKLPASAAPHRPPKSENISHDEHQRLLTLLEHTRCEYDALIDFIDAERASGKSFSELAVNVDPAWLKDDAIEFEHVIPRPLSSDVSTLHNQIEFLEQELGKAIRVSNENSAEESSLREQIEVLRTQLLESRHETIELRIQNSDLSDQADRSSSNMTWEQRKEQLMHQLESDTSLDPETRAQSNQIASIVESSQREIDLRDHQLLERDREIDELKMLLTHQSSVTNGIAVGAAAVAQILDADELLQSEREKLRVLQREWEEKLRNAEIEISLERARISRERLEFESSVLSMPDESEGDGGGNHCQRSDQEPLGKPRRWLRRLGLRED